MIKRKYVHIIGFFFKKSAAAGRPFIRLWVQPQKRFISLLHFFGGEYDGKVYCEQNWLKKLQFEVRFHF